MSRLNDLALGRLDAVKLDPRIIQVRPGWNYRDTTTPVSEAHIQWLMESIKEVGVQEPIRVEYVDGKVYLVNGECRLKACLRLYEAAWLELSRERERNMTAQQKLDRLHRDAYLKQLPIRRLGAVWLDACRGIFKPVED